MRAAASISARCENAWGKFHRWLPFLNRIPQQRSRSGQRVYSAGRDGPPVHEKQIRKGIAKGIWLRFQVLLSACTAYGMHWPIAGWSTDCRDAPAMSCHTEIPFKNTLRMSGLWTSRRFRLCSFSVRTAPKQPPRPQSQTYRSFLQPLSEPLRIPAA